MMTDKELLELAAKAAGIEYQCADDGEIIEYLGGGLQLAFGGGKWNPLTSDGDALRLAVRLGIIVCVDYDTGYCGIHLPGCRGKYDLGEKLNGDPYAATRRAIVRAAVEMGANLK